MGPERGKASVLLSSPGFSWVLLIALLLLQEESGLHQEALEVYQQCLGELLLALAGGQTFLLGY